MLNRRSLLKLLPAGILGSLFPAKKLFAGEKAGAFRVIEETFKFVPDASLKDNYIKLGLEKQWVLKDGESPSWPFHIKMCESEYSNYIDGAIKEYKIKQITYVFPKEEFQEKNCSYTFGFESWATIFGMYLTAKDGKREWVKGNIDDIFGNIQEQIVPTDEDIKKLIYQNLNEHVLGNRGPSHTDSRTFSPEICVHLFRIEDMTPVVVYVSQDLTGHKPNVYIPSIKRVKSFNGENK